MNGGHDRSGRARSILLRILLIELLVLLVTGIALFFVYRPAAGQSWPGLTVHQTFGIRVADVVRALHAVAAWFLVLTALAAAVALARRRQALLGLGIGVGGFVTLLTGLLLPWDQLALRAVKVGTNYRGYTFLFDSLVRFVLVQGTEITPRTLAVWLVVHALVLGPALTGLVVLGWRREPAGARSGIMHTGPGTPSCPVNGPTTGGPMPSGDEIRGAQQRAWAGLSAAWEKWDSVIVAQLGPVGAAIIECLDLADDQQHLDIAAGTGEPGLSIARLTPKGRVVLTDIAPEMLDVAARRARAQGIANIETKVCSADDLPFDDAAFDSVSVRFGYMFFPDMARATAEFARVLKPGGRLCASVWVKPDQNPWTGIATRAIATEAVLAPPDPDGPNMFRCADPGYVSALYEAAGLQDVAEWDVGVELVTPSAAQYWEMISEHVSLVAAALERVDDPARGRIRAAAMSEVSAFEKDGEIRVPGVARCIVGTKGFSPH